MQLEFVNNNKTNNNSTKKTMKKTLLASLVATSALFTACGNKTTQPTSDQDSAAYAIGVFIAQNVGNIDTTLNASIVIEAVNDVYSKNFDKKLKEAQAYLTAVQIAQQAYFGVDSTMSPAVIAAGITDMLNKKPGIKPEEVNQYIMNYVGKASLKKADEFLAKADAEPGIQKTASGLRYKIEAPGNGEKINSVDTVMVHYTLTDYEGKTLDSSRDRNEAFRVNLPGGVVPGFAEGIQLLTKGGKATIWMPATLGYGQNGSGSVAPNQALKFEIEVIDVIPGKVIEATPAN